MDSRTQELFDQAVTQAEQLVAHYQQAGKSTHAMQAGMALRNLRTLRKHVRDGTARPDTTPGPIGWTRFIGEWGEDTNLYHTVAQLADEWKKQARDGAHH